MMSDIFIPHQNRLMNICNLLFFIVIMKIIFLTSVVLRIKKIKLTAQFLAHLKVPTETQNSKYL